ncbi:MAG: von Willebrand factor type A domain-containing protein, partial [Clostridia bacterium]
MKKNIKIIALIVIVALFSAVLMSCTGNYTGKDDYNYYPAQPDYAQESGDEFTEITENKFLKASEFPSSSFALTVSTAAYPNLRRYINNGYKINKNQVRIEEIVNYFKYDYPAPNDGDPLSVQANFFDCPWNEEAKLLTVGLRAEDVEIGSIHNNLVFLLDVSGSMRGADRLGLMQSAFLLLLDNLGENDVVSIVTYAGGDSVLLSGANGAEKDRISNVIDDLAAGGSTAGAAGIVTAYELAEEYFIEGGNNRVILATDGDFNVGISSREGLESLITQKRESGIYLTALGFGFGNLKSNNLETLANKGNGSYAYIDTINEARKVLVEEIGGTLYTIARDAKARVEFNPEYVDSYRLLGYENLLLTEEQWEEPEADAGEIGAGFTVTAV